MKRDGVNLEESVRDEGPSEGALGGNPEGRREAAVHAGRGSAWRGLGLGLGFLLGIVGLGGSGCAPLAPAKVRNTSRTFTTVVLDAGHGAHDSGARIRKGPAEKDLALDVVRRMVPPLREAGFRTVLTRNCDVFIPLDTRVDLSNAEQDAVFVSVHFNDGGRSRVFGVESYYFSPESRQMAERLVRTLSGATGSPNRGARTARFRVIRNNENPAVLMECGYLSSGKESAWIRQEKYREKIAAGIVRGIVEQRGGPIVRKSEPCPPGTVPAN
ncbi:MAG: hypothetical protein RLZZ244_2218 [Verrucomicrobiota bacterium]|jgi:N-acetylmuramoyl-L-alanine amidase